MLENENGLSHFLRRVGDTTLGRRAATDDLAGWILCAGRLTAAKNWAVSGAETELVRALSALIQEGNTRIGQVLHEHQAALDTLASEAFGRYGIQPHTIEPNLTLSPIESEF